MFHLFHFILLCHIQVCIQQIWSKLSNISLSFQVSFPLPNELKPSNTFQVSFSCLTLECFYLTHFPNLIFFPAKALHSNCTSMKPDRKWQTHYHLLFTLIIPVITYPTSLFSLLAAVSPDAHFQNVLWNPFNCSVPLLHGMGLETGFVWFVCGHPWKYLNIF